MSSPLANRISSKKRLSMAPDEGDIQNQSMDLTRIQSSGRISTAVSSILTSVTSQKELIDKEVREQQEKIKDFEEFQKRMQLLQKESKMKDKEFLEVVNKNSEKIAVSNSKSEDLEQKLGDTQKKKRDVNFKIKEISSKIDQSQQAYNEQVKFKDEAFAKALSNKDDFINDLNAQIKREHANFEKQKAMRIMTESEITEKGETNMKLKGRIDKVQRMINQKRPDPKKAEEIEKLKKQLQQQRENLQNRLNERSKKQDDFHNLKDQEGALEREKLQLLNKKDKLINDLEDQDYIQGRIKQTKDSIAKMQLQADGIENKIKKKQEFNTGMKDNTAELLAIIEMIHTLNNYERTCQIIQDNIRDLENKIHFLSEQTELLTGEEVQNKDKLLHTLGKLKGSSAGGLGFIIKQSLIENRTDCLKETLGKYKGEKDTLKSKINDTLNQLKKKELESITKEELSKAISINDDVQKELAILSNQVTESDEVFNKLRRDFNQSQERLRIAYTVDVGERLKELDLEITDAQGKLQKSNESTKKVDQDQDKLFKSLRVEHQKPEFKRLQTTAQAIRDDYNEIKTDIALRKKNFDSLNKNQSDIDKMPIQTLSELISQLQILDQQTLSNKKDVADIELRTKDLQLLYKDLVKQLFKEIYNEMQSRLSVRTNQIQNLIKKDQNLISIIGIRKVQLMGIQGQLQEEDKELVEYYKKYESVLTEVVTEEDQLSLQLRQFQSQIDKIEKQSSRISKENFSLEEVYAIIVESDGMETPIKTNNDKLDECTKRIESLDPLIRDLELKIKQERISDCETQQKQAFNQVDKLKRILDRIQASINMIQKDQEYLIDEFNDMEKKKESLGFKQEMDKKNKDYKGFIMIKDRFAQQYEAIEKQFDERIQNVDNAAGEDFLKIKQESEKLKDEVGKQLQQIEEGFVQEVDACKELIDKMVVKYKNKKEKHGTCTAIKQQKEYELALWNERLLAINEKIQMIENQMNMLGMKENDEAYESYLKYINELDQLRMNNGGYIKQVHKFQERIAEECDYLEKVEIKVVKTSKIIDIIKALENLNQQGLEKDIDRFENQLKQSEKDIDTFINKIRNQKLAETEQKHKDITENMSLLIKKIIETGKEVKEFKNEVTDASKDRKSGANDLLFKIEQYLDLIEQSKVQKEILQKRLDQVKNQLRQVDRKTVSLNEIGEMINESNSVANLVTVEIKKLNEILLELIRLKQIFQDGNKFEDERQNKIKKAKQTLADNQALINQINKNLAGNYDKGSQFDEVYKAMMLSEDYQPHAVIEKKIRRIAQIRAECQKLEEQKQDLEKLNKKLIENDIDHITDLNQLTAIVKESEKINQSLNQEVKEVNLIGTGFEKKRKKLADAKIRQVASKRKDQVDEANKQLNDEVQLIKTLEETLQQRQSDPNNTDKLTPEREAEVKIAIEHLKNEVGNIRVIYDKVAEEVRNITADIGSRDLENSEPLPKLAKDIERLQNQHDYLKDLRIQIEKIKAEISFKTTLISTIDTENKMKMILNKIQEHQKNFEEIRILINDISTVSRSQEGYYSGEDDANLYSGIVNEGKEQLIDINACQKAFSDLQGDTERAFQEIVEKKSLMGGQVKKEDIDEFNIIITKLEQRFERIDKKMTMVRTGSFSNREKISNNKLEQKLERRKGELDEIQKIIKDIQVDSKDIKERIQKEVEEHHLNTFYTSYCNRLNDILPQIEKILQNAEGVSDERKAIQKHQERVVAKITTKTEQRVPLYMDNLELKRKVADCLRTASSIHSVLKEVFKETNTIFSKKPVAENKPIYQAAAGDEIDKMFAFYFNKYGISIPIQRLGGGYYMFGTKKIFCKIINGKLVVRVGGGYMGIEEFIMQYGQQEADKAKMAAEGYESNKGGNKNVSGGYSSVALGSQSTKRISKKLTEANIVNDGDTPESSMKVPIIKNSETLLVTEDYSLGSNRNSVSGIGNKKSSFSTAIEESKQSLMQNTSISSKRDSITIKTVKLTTATTTKIQTQALQRAFDNLLELLNQTHRMIINKHAEGRNILPENCSDTIIEAFLASLISIISLKTDQRYVNKSVSVLLEYLKNDGNVFAKFKPNKPLLRKMNMSVHIMSQSQQESEISLEFCSFLLRYHRALDYGDFSDNPYVVQRLRRYEDFKCWAELDDISAFNEKFNKEFIDYKQTNENALQEILQHLEKIVRDNPTRDETMREIDIVKERLYQDLDQTVNQLSQQQASFMSKQVQQMQNIPIQGNRSEIAGMDGQQYKKVLELMLDLEKKMENRFDEVQLDIKREMSRVLDDREIKQDLQQMMEEKFDNIEFGFNQKIIGRIELLEKAYDQQINNYSVFENRFDLENQKALKIEDTLKDQIDLIQALNNKLALQEESVKDTKQYFFNKVTTLEKDIINKAFGEAAQIKYDFTAHEETIKKLEDEIEALQKDFVIFKDRTEKSVQEGINLTKQTRNDYIMRMKEMYDENNRMIKETKEIIDLIKSKNQEAIGHLDKKQNAMLQHMQSIETDFKVQVDRNLRELESTDLRQQKEIADTNDYYKKLRSEVIDLGSHIGQEISRVINQSNATLNEYGKRQGDTELGFRKQLDDIHQKFNFYTKDFENIAENFLKLNDGQNKLLISLNSHDQDIARIRSEMGNSLDQIRKMEDFLSNNSKLNSLVEEANKLWTFFQKFIDEHSVDRIKIIRSKDTPVTDKINCMDWLARYAEFVTPDQISNVVLAFKDIYSGSDSSLRDQFIQHRHNSEAVPTVIQMIRNLRMKKNTISLDDETFDQNMSILLSILEPLLINDQNLETVFKLNVVKDLCELIVEQLLPSENGGQGTKSFRQHFKYAIRCITSCLRHEIGVADMMKQDLYFKRVLRILEEFTEEEIVANSCKIVRLVLRDDTYYERVVLQYQKLGDFLLQLMTQHFYSAAVIQETTASLRNYTRKPNYINNISPPELKILINVIRDPKFEKVKYVCLQAIKNISKSAEHERFLKQVGATDVIMMANMAQGAGNQIGGQMVNNALGNILKK